MIHNFFMRCCCRRWRPRKLLSHVPATVVPPNNAKHEGPAKSGVGAPVARSSHVNQIERQLSNELLRRLRSANSVDRIPGGDRWYEEVEILRFVRARKHLAESEDLFHQAMAWRRAYVDSGGVVPISEGSFGQAHASYIDWCERGPGSPRAARPPEWWVHIYRNVSLRLYGSDPNGLPILYSSISADDFSACVKAVGFEAFEMFGVMANDFFLDAARDAARTKSSDRIVHGGYVVMDVKGLSFRSFADARILTQASAVLKFLHPERQQHCFIVRAPRLFTHLWALIRPFIGPSTLAKITIFGTGDCLVPLTEALGRENVPAILGGTLTGVAPPPRLAPRLDV